MSGRARKEELVNEIAKHLGVDAPRVSTGSTATKEIFLLVNEVLGLGLDESLTKPELAERICAASGLSWPATAESAGGTVTVDGLEQVLNAVRFFTDNKTNWHWKIGERHTREERVKLYGGGMQVGIAHSSQTPNVIVYSDPKKAATFGYDFDGWTVDGDVYLYTGEGKEGNQSLSSIGNDALLHHKRDGRSVRVNVADGIAPGTKDTKLHRYIGEFAIDAEDPFFLETAPDKNKDLREVIVFRLIPLDSEAPSKGPRTNLQDRGRSRPQQVPLESSDSITFLKEGNANSTAERREQQLVHRLAKFLNARGYATTRWKIPIPDQQAPLYTDMYVDRLKELIEAKASCERSDIRMAVGQLLDYRRYLDVEKLTVLLPCKPSPDLRNYLESCGIGLFVELEDGSFCRGTDL